MLWYFKQLLPLAYWTRYRDTHGKRHLCLWRMWLGWCFNVTDVVVAG